MTLSTNDTLSLSDKKRFLDAAIDVARFAGARADTYWRKRDTLKIETKGVQDFVSIADRKTEELIVEELTKRFPDHVFLGEEGDKAKPKPGQPIWVIDPIDGTTNFLRGMPLWAVSVGCVVDGVPEVGVIVCPRQDEVFAAATGMGATLDNRPIHASKTTALTAACVGLGSSNRTPVAQVLALQDGLIDAGVDVRRIGSACLQIAWTACGRLDGYVEAHLNSWDCAAGLVILREAGAVANAFDSGDWLASGNPFACGAPGVIDGLRALVERR